MMVRKGKNQPSLTRMLIGTVTGLARFGDVKVSSLLKSPASLKPLKWSVPDAAPVDATEAVALARRAGFQAGRTIFLDVEKAFPANSPYESYVLKWLEVVQGSGYRTALYCFPGQISWCASHGISIWTVHLNKNTGTKNPQTGVITWSKLSSPLPADPIDAGATGTQGRFYCQAAGLNVELDYDRWTVADPSDL
jgi:hypothetical protein